MVVQWEARKSATQFLFKWLLKTLFKNFLDVLRGQEGSYEKLFF